MCGALKLAQNEGRVGQTHHHLAVTNTLHGPHIVPPGPKDVALQRRCPELIPSQQAEILSHGQLMDAGHDTRLCAVPRPPSVQGRLHEPSMRCAPQTHGAPCQGDAGTSHDGGGTNQSEGVDHALAFSAGHEVSKLFTGHFPGFPFKQVQTRGRVDLQVLLLHVSHRFHPSQPAPGQFTFDPAANHVLRNLDRMLPPCVRTVGVICNVLPLCERPT